MRAFEKSKRSLLDDLVSNGCDDTDVVSALKDLEIIHLHMRESHMRLNKTTKSSGYEMYKTIVTMMNGTCAPDEQLSMAQQRKYVHCVYTEERVCEAFGVDRSMTVLRKRLEPFADALQPIELYLDNMRMSMDRIAAKIATMLIGYALGDYVNITK